MASNSSDGDHAQLIHDTANGIIDDWIEESPPRQFTLYDITCAVRQVLGRGVNVLHYGPDGVHDLALGLLNDKIGDPALGWNRVLTEPPGLKPGNAKPQLYYHMSTDPADYGRANPTVAVTQTNWDGTRAPDPATVMGTTLVCAPKDRRLCVTKDVMEASGMKPLDFVEVIADAANGCLVIRKKDPNGVANPLRTYTVDLRGTIRVSPSLLDDVGLAGNKFTAVNDPVLGVVVRQQN